MIWYDAYDSTSIEVKSKMEKGEPAEVIRRTLTKPLDLWGPLPIGRMPDTYEVHNAVEQRMARIRHEALEDALAKRPPCYRYA